MNFLLKILIVCKKNPSKYDKYFKLQMHQSKPKCQDFANNCFKQARYRSKLYNEMSRATKIMSVQSNIQGYKKYKCTMKCPGLQKS